MKDLKVCLFLITQKRCVKKRKKSDYTDSKSLVVNLLPYSPTFRTGPESF